MRIYSQKATAWRLTRLCPKWQQSRLGLNDRNVQRVPFSTLLKPDLQRPLAPFWWRRIVMRLTPRVRCSYQRVSTRGLYNWPCRLPAFFQIMSTVLIKGRDLRRKGKPPPPAHIFPSLPVLMGLFSASAMINPQLASITGAWLILSQVLLSCTQSPRCRASEIHSLHTRCRLTNALHARQGKAPSVSYTRRCGWLFFLFFVFSFLHTLYTNNVCNRSRGCWWIDGPGSN